METKPANDVFVCFVLEDPKLSIYNLMKDHRETQ